jgi:hypothetical protein
MTRNLHRVVRSCAGQGPLTPLPHPRCKWNDFQRTWRAIVRKPASATSYSRSLKHMSQSLLSGESHMTAAPSVLPLNHPKVT